MLGNPRWFLSLVVGLGACSDGPPRVPLGDGAVPKDASTDGSDDGGDDARDGGPVLPPADDEVTLPFAGESVPYEFTVRANLAKLDVVLSVDTTTSFAGEIDNLQSSLESVIVPELRSRVDDTAFAVTRFQDFPIPPFGEPSDIPFELLTAITTSTSRVRNAMSDLDQPLGNGGDFPEAGGEALYQIATGAGYSHAGTTYIEEYEPRSSDDPVAPGGVGFRPRALRVVVHVTDAPAHAGADYADELPGVRGVASALTALKGARVHVIGIASFGQARGQLEALAIGTDSTTAPNDDGECETGLGDVTYAPTAGRCPLVYDVDSDGSGLSSTLVDGIVSLVDGVAFERVEGRTVDNRLQFVSAIEAVEAEGPLADGVTIDYGSDDLGDAFLAVPQGVDLRFRVHLENDTIRPSTVDQTFVVQLEAVGDGVVMGKKRLRVRVPKGSP